MNRQSVLVLIGAMLLSVVLLAFVLTWDESTSPQQQTRDRLRQVQRSIFRFYVDNGRMPTSLTEISGESWDTGTVPTDAWGHPISYSVQSGRVILETLGRDGLPGGTDMDEDIVWIFSSDDAQPPGP